MKLSIPVLTLWAALATASKLPLNTALGAADAADRERIQGNFEENFFRTLDWKYDNDTVKLVGYKKILLPDKDIAALEEAIRQDPGQFGQFAESFYDPVDKTLRVYFPVEGALLQQQNGSLLEATALGEFPDLRQRGQTMLSRANTQGDGGSDGVGLNVLGRYQTDNIHGVASNIIKDGIIYLAESVQPVRRYGPSNNILVYDFGWREGTHHHDDDDDDDNTEDGGTKGQARHRRRGGKVSCKKNHGRVCSLAFGINHGRCPRDYSSCIDYNGFKKNCKNKSDKLAFINSDCHEAMARGHCWNEVM